MKRMMFLFVLVFAWSAGLQSAEVDVSRMDVFVTPFYNAKGPKISVGQFSKGLASKSDEKFVSTIRSMKESWDKLTFAELYVAAIRLYDMGYRKEAVYWYYTAQYRGRLFSMLLDEKKLGGIGAPGFELRAANGAFFELAGPYVTSFALLDFEHLMGVIERVQKEGEKIPDMKAAYPKVAFVPVAEWEGKNKELNAGMGKLRTLYKEEREAILQKRQANGTDADFSKLKSKELPGR